MIDCSKTENYLIEKLRMTKRAKSGICKIKCSDCPLCSKNNGISEYISCISFEMYHPEKAIEIVQRWSDEHPQRTYLSESWNIILMSSFMILGYLKAYVHII